MSFVEELVKVMDCAGDKEIIVVCDFDGTLTTSDSAVTMNGMAKYLGYDSDFSKERSALYEEYGKYLSPGEDEDTRYKMLEKWWRAQMELFKKYSVPPDSYTDACSKLGIILRDGVGELMAFCEKHDIPVFVVSAGLGNMIIPILAFSGCLSMNMRALSNFVRYKDDKPVSITPVVTPVNKASHLYLELESFDNYHAVVFGNCDDDLNLLPQELCTTVKVTD